MPGVVGVGFLALPVTTTGAACDPAQGVGRPGSLNARLHEAKPFCAIAVATVAAVAADFPRLQPGAGAGLVRRGVGFPAPPLLFMMPLMTSDRAVMGDRVNDASATGLDRPRPASHSSQQGCLVATWFL